MKKRFLQTLLAGTLVFTSFFASAQMVPNGDFEQALSNGWVITSAASANNAARIQTLNYDNGSEVRQISAWGGQYFLFLSNTNIRATVRTQKFALTSQPKGIRFQLMYFRPGSQFQVDLELTKAAELDTNNVATIDTITNIRYPISSGSAIFPWQDYYLPLHDSIWKDQQPDSIVIYLSAGPTVNAAVAIDDVVLVDYAASQGAISFFTGGVNVYPIPAKDFVNVNYTLNMKSRVKLDVYDVQGRLVKTLMHEEQTNGEHENKLDVSSLKQGIYFLRINTNEKTETIRFSVQ